MSVETEIKLTVGMGGTVSIGSDRYPFTLVEIVDEKTVIVQEDSHRRIDKNGLSEIQDWEITPCPDGTKTTLTLRKNGRWVRKGDPMNSSWYYSFGVRRAYQDPHF
jgi:hypothetical protein